MQTHNHDVPVNQSEVARLTAQIEAEYFAATQGLSGFASGTARHDFISARMENLDAIHQQLIKKVGREEALQIVIRATIEKPS